MVNDPRQFFNMLKTVRNPMSLLNNNPVYKQAIDYINQNGGDPEKAFYKLAEEKGVNPRDILGQFM